MQISPIQQTQQLNNKQVNFTSKVFIKNCSEILQSESAQRQIARLEKNGTNDIVSLRAYHSKKDGSGFINMNIINHKTMEEREQDFFFEKGKLKLGVYYKKLLKEKPTDIGIC